MFFGRHPHFVSPDLRMISCALLLEKLYKRSLFPSFMNILSYFEVCILYLREVLLEFKLLLNKHYGWFYCR
jgi:hypothetical protein